MSDSRKRSTKKVKLLGVRQANARKIDPAKRRRKLNFSGPLRPSNSAEPPQTSPREGLLDSVYQTKSLVDMAYESRPGLMPRGEVHPYIQILIHSGMSLQQFELFRNVTRIKRSDFYIRPQFYIMVPDMLLVRGLVGLSLDRQFMLLCSGMVSGEVTRQGSGVFPTIQSILDNVPREPGAPVEPPAVPDITIQVKEPDPVPSNPFGDISPLSL